MSKRRNVLVCMRLYAPVYSVMSLAWLRVFIGFGPFRLCLLVASLVGSRGSSSTQEVFASGSAATAI